MTLSKAGRKYTLTRYFNWLQVKETMWSVSHPRAYLRFRTFMMGQVGNATIFPNGVIFEGTLPTTPGGSVLFLDFFRNLTDIAVVWWILAHRSREAVLNFGLFSPTADVRKMQCCQWYHNSVEGVSKTPMFYRGVSRAQDSIVYVNTHAPTRTSTAIYLHCLYEYNNWVWHDHVHSCCNYGL